MNMTTLTEDKSKESLQRNNAKSYRMIRMPDGNNQCKSILVDDETVLLFGLDQEH